MKILYVKILYGLLTMLHFTVLTPLISQSVISPADWLKTDYGYEFTPYHMFDDYVRYLAETSSYVMHTEYGITNEGRSLNLLVVSAPNHLDNLDQIKERNIARMDGSSNPQEGYNDPAIIWLSYSVHGNEAGAAESALSVLYMLSSPTAEIASWLDNVIVIIDPCLNPDGYSRYTHWNRTSSGTFVDHNPYSFAHQEPWPRGRVNHYLFDLNRDWAWATQVETRQRLLQYNQWMPHIHTDLHEMNINDGYFFAPAAEPIHDLITPWQRSFMDVVGQKNSSEFDTKGWVYYTKENFDLFYPSYGDTYPLFNGAIGMTYEQAGKEQAARAVRIASGDTLTIRDRINHHVQASLNTISVASDHRQNLLDQFNAYFNSEIKSRYDYYIISRDDRVKLLTNFTDLLDLHGIRYKQASSDQSIKRVYRFKTFDEGHAQIKKGDLVIPINQPKGRLVDVLLNPSGRLSEELTYDITAWSLCHSLTNEAWAVKGSITTEAFVNSTQSMTSTNNEVSIAFGSTPNSIVAYSEIGDLLNDGYKLRTNIKETVLNGHTFPVGSMFILKSDNKDKVGWISILNKLGTNAGLSWRSIKSGKADSGIDLGSASMVLIDRPRIAMLFGADTQPTSAGHIWHFFEKEFVYPCARIQSSIISHDVLSNYNVLIMPNGDYKPVDSTTLEIIMTWVDQGGKLIAEGTALSRLSEMSQSGLVPKIYSDDVDSDHVPKYVNRDVIGLDRHNPGSVVRVMIDDTHPMTTGLGKSMALLKIFKSGYHLLENGWNIGHLTDDFRHEGYMGLDVIDHLRKTFVVAQKKHGKGQMIYFTDPPLFRSFWESSKLLFTQAVIK